MKFDTYCNILRGENEKLEEKKAQTVIIDGDTVEQCISLHLLYTNS